MKDCQNRFTLAFRLLAIYLALSIQNVPKRSRQKERRALYISAAAYCPVWKQGGAISTFTTPSGFVIVGLNIAPVGALPYSRQKRCVWRKRNV